MSNRWCPWSRLTMALVAMATAGAARSQSIAVDFAELTHMNTMVATGGSLVIERVDALDATGTWYRYPWGHDVWDIQLQKNPASRYNATEGCLRTVDNFSPGQSLRAFNGRLMRIGPANGPVYVRTLDNGAIAAVPDFASRPGSVRFVTFGSHSGWAEYVVTLNYTSGGPSVIAVPIAGATAYPRDNAGSGWQTQGVADLVSVCAGRYGDMVEIANPRTGADLSSVIISHGPDLAGPLAVSLSLSRYDYEAGYIFTGAAWSGTEQQTALRAPSGNVAWHGIEWSATIADLHSEIIADVYCGEAAAGGSVSWEYAGSFTLASGAGSADFAQPCAGEFVRCDLEMTAELAASPVLHSLAFAYHEATGAPDALTAALRLRPCRPNPFNPRTTIGYDLPEAGLARLRVFDLAGRLVRTLVDEGKERGSHEAVWDGRDAAGRAVGAGAYLARLEFGGRVETVRVGLVR